ncbi:MAG: DUF6519 domain-containing protein [Pseudomonadota bacterium]
MGTQDISRNAFDSSKNYVSVRQQQGRVLTDDDWNENNRIHETADRLAKADIIGAAASPDNGFAITAPRRTAAGTDFTIAAGRFYLGGQALSLDQDQTFRLQRDWLQGPGSEAATSVGSDLVVLESYQQVVTAVEDSELYEVALGGADTTTRLRTVQRVHLVPRIGTTDCVEAWSRFLTQRLKVNELQEDHSLPTDTTLEATFVTEGNNGDLCKPNTAGGYLGAENQTIRVQLRDDKTFIWGFDNAAPLYRVQLDAGRTKCTLLTPPKDQYHWPQAEQTVEILAWSSVLPNGEKTAEHEGFLSKVTAGYNPATGEITLADAVPTSGFDDWHDRDDAKEVANEDDFYYMRVWNRGSDQDSPVSIPTDAGNPVDLGFTGIQVTFTGDDLRSGDYWLISARPSAPTEVVPWQLTVTPGANPTGVKRYFAPLAIINWREDGKGGVHVIDCRGKFRPLAEARCCIELVAIPGYGWERVFDQVGNNRDAVICMPPGDYPLTGRHIIENKGRLRILGAGPSTQISATASDTALSFDDCDRVEFSHASIKVGNQHGGGIKGGLAFNRVNHIEVHHCSIRTRAARYLDMACLRVDNTFGSKTNLQGRVKIHDCEFYPGHLQAGVLLINVAYADISRNLIAPSGPNIESAQHSLVSKAFVANLANNSLIPQPQTNRIFPQDTRLIVTLRRNRTITFRTDPELGEFWKRELARADVTEKLATFDTDDAAFVHTYLSHRLRKQLRRLARGREARRLDGWFKSLNGGASAVVGQGIVIGGRRAKQIQIRDNEIRDATQGVHIGLSHKTANRTKEGADIANSVSVQDNLIGVGVAAGSLQQQHGIYIGNAQKAQVRNNTLELQRRPGMRHVPVEAIRVHGFFGPMLRVIGNCADESFVRTVRVQQRGPVKPHRVSVVKDNYPSDTANADG